MAYITREDGERFVIPSYRDVISAKKKSLLKKEILLLSENHGQYITLQRKNIDQYEVAFSSEPGYLLGETVWHYFKRPLDLIYCEAIPNTSEAILVIVKAGSVYLDGSFPIDSIPDELVIFRTQQSNFNIYIYGDVPISEKPQEDKFALDTSSVRSFTVLEKPVFPTLPIVKAFQLQLVDVVLKSQGIGVFPTKTVLAAAIILAAIWFGYDYLQTRTEEIPIATVFVQTDSYQQYKMVLSSPNPSQEIDWVSSVIAKFFSLQGWEPDSITYSKGLLRASVKSEGSRTNILFDWAKQNRMQVEIGANGFYLTANRMFLNRNAPTIIYPLDEVVANLIDKLSYIIPGNNLSVGQITTQGKYKQADLIINVNNISVTTINLVGKQLSQLPLILTSITLSLNNGYLAGTINLKALGS